MTEKDFCDNLLNGNIIVDENGHNPFYGWGIEHFLENIEHSIESYTKFNEERNELCKERELIIDSSKRITFPLYIDASGNCECCGGRIGWQFLEEEQKIKCIIVDWSKFRLIDGEDKGLAYDDSICKYKNKSKVTNVINVFDNLVFENWFNYSEDYPEKGKQFKDEYSLNNYAGRVNISKVHASRNVAYGQTGNASIYVYVNAERDEILLINGTYYYDQETEQEINSEKNLNELGYTLVGDHSCDVWRWMAANKSDLEKYEYSSEGYVERYEEPVEVKDVKHGQWQIDHYFGTDEHDSFKVNNIPVIAQLKLIK